MKMLVVLLLVAIAGDFSLFSGEYTRHAWSETRAQLKSIQTYADEATATLVGG